MSTQQAAPQLAGATVYVSFSAEINIKTAESLLSTMANLANANVAAVHLAISTPGGDVASGINLFNVLRAMPFELTTHNVGNVDSIGNAVFLAGTMRYASPHSTFMFHGVGFDFVNQTFRLEEKLLREHLAAVLTNQSRIGSIIKERTKIEDVAIEGLFREAQTKNAAEAVSLGIVNEVREFSIPPGAPVVQLVFQR